MGNVNTDLAADIARVERIKDAEAAMPETTPMRRFALNRATEADMLEVRRILNGWKAK